MLFYVVLATFLVGQATVIESRVFPTASPEGPTPGPIQPSGGGVTYIRWGDDTCPDTLGTETVYSGKAAGSWYEHGGTSDYLCLPDNPEYRKHRKGVQSHSPVYTNEYPIDDPVPLPGITTHHNASCAVCRSSLRSSLLMIPARVSCPDTSWTKEYEGYLMSAYKGHHRREAICMEEDPEAVSKENVNTNGALFYHMEANCNGEECLYEADKELTCCVCTK